MQIITVAIIKGGAGKTATAAALSQAAASAGKKVLAVDLDPQANLTAALGADPNRPGAVQIFRGAPAADAMQDTEQQITVIAGHRDLAGVRTSPGSARRLRDALETVRDAFDLCVIDTPPTLGELVYNALNAADGLLIPLETDTYNLQGLYQITDLAAQIRGSNPRLQILGAIITRYDGRPKLNRYIRGVIEEQAAAAGIPFLTAIPAGVAVREAAAMQQSLFEYAGNSKPAAEYMKLYNMITKTEE